MTAPQMHCLPGQQGSFAHSDGKITLTPVDSSQDFPSPRGDHELWLFAVRPGWPEKSCPIPVGISDVWTVKDITVGLPENPGSNAPDVRFRIELRIGSQVLFHTHEEVFIVGSRKKYPDPPMHTAIAQAVDGELSITPTSDAGFGTHGEIIQYVGSVPRGQILEFKSWHPEEIQVEFSKGELPDEGPLQFVIATDEGRKFVTLPVVPGVPSEE